MKTTYLFIFALIMPLLTGCMDVVINKSQLAEIPDRCVFIEPIKSSNEHLGAVVRDVLEKEFVRQQFDICDSDDATILIYGSLDLLAINTAQAELFGPVITTSNDSISSVSLTIKDKQGRVFGSASYDNKNRGSAIKIGRELGAKLAKKLKK